MNDKILIKSEASLSMVFLIRIIPVVIGVVLAATCLVWETILGDWAIFASAGLGGLIALVGILLMFASWKQGIYVTEKNVYGTTLWGKRVDIPLDSISAVSLTSISSGVTVASSAGRISFAFLENNIDVFNVISKLIQDRQNSKKQVSTIMKENASTNADELKKYKDLLDSGVITQEEFDAKKKQLLGL